MSMATQTAPRRASTANARDKFSVGQRVKFTKAAIDNNIPPWGRDWLLGTVVGFPNTRGPLVTVRLDGNRTASTYSHSYFEPAGPDAPPAPYVEPPKPRPPRKRKPVVPYVRRETPDEKDRIVFDLLAQGMKVRAIADRFNIASESVERRIEKVRAWRWATTRGVRLLSAEERERLLAFEMELANQ